MRGATITTTYDRIRAWERSLPSSSQNSKAADRLSKFWAPQSAPLLHRPTWGKYIMRLYFSPDGHWGADHMAQILQDVGERELIRSILTKYCGAVGDDCAVLSLGDIDLLVTT